MEHIVRKGTMAVLCLKDRKAGQSGERHEKEKEPLVQELVEAFASNKARTTELLTTT